MAFAEDLAPFLADFGVTAVVAGVAVSAIFDAPTINAFGLAADTAPSLTLATDDATGAVVGGSVSIAGTAYTVASIEPDGTGMTTLVLKS